MTTTQIEYFLAAAQTLNFTVAADLVFTTRSSMSRQITSLEEELGAQLFSRENNTLTLTTLGEEFYVRIQRHYVDLTQILYEFSQLKAGMNGKINIGVMEYQLSDKVLSEAVGRLLRKYPKTIVSVKRYGYADLAQGIIAGTIDVAQAFLNESIKIPDRCSLPLGQNLCCLAVPRCLRDAMPASITSADIPALKGDLPIVIRAEDTYPMFAQPSMLRRIHSLPKPLQEEFRYVSSADSVNMYLMAGAGVSFSNEQNFMTTNPKIALIPIDDDRFPPLAYGLIWSGKNVNPLLDQFILTVKELSHAA